MKGLVIWAQSDCRSMMGLYRSIISQVSCPVRVVVRDYKAKSQRQEVGFAHEEFSDIKFTVIGDNYAKGLAILNECKGFHHLFASYQNAPTYRRLILAAKQRGDKIGVMSESPCVMDDGVRGWVKEHVYYPIVLKSKVAPVIEVSDFIVNLSGDSSQALRQIGWRAEQIVPFGYFPPPIIGSKIVRRSSNRDFHILVTGIMTWHRAPDIVMKALVLLKRWGVKYRATFTQGGPMLESLRRIAQDNDLTVSFPGCVPLKELIKLYETCSVYVAAGRREPWGMRLNDALQCGAPLVVSRGMGGAQLVDEYGCGISFDVDDYIELAHKLRSLIEGEPKYINVCNNAIVAARLVSPNVKAGCLIKTISHRFEGWFKDANGLK